MPKQKTDDLMQLINSLSRAEKRHFRLFVKRNQASSDILFLQLFDFLDRQGEYEEEQLLQKIPGIKKTQLSNLKAHLYKQLLISLRLLNKGNNEDILIRENIDYARLLYNKGLYRQALDILEKAKERARAAGMLNQALEILEFEKRIEGQYITRSIEGRAEQLADETNLLTRQIESSHRFSNLSLRMYGLYLRIGFVRNERDYHQLKQLFQSQLPSTSFQELDFWGRIYYCQSFIWYHHIAQDFPLCYRYAQRWVDLFREHPHMISLHGAMYLKAMHNLLNALYNIVHFPRFVEVLQELETFYATHDFGEDRNLEGLYHLYRYIHLIKLHFMEGTFKEGLTLVPGLLKIIDDDTYNWDQHRELVFYYRIACLYFGSGDNSRAIDFLNRIINQNNPDYREDIQSFARILNLIAHFEMGNRQLVEYQLKSVYRFLLKAEELNEVQKVIIQFLRKTPRMKMSALKEEFLQLKEKLVALEQRRFERRPFLYLDIISWLESKIEGVTVQEVIRRKFAARYGK